MFTTIIGLFTGPLGKFFTYGVIIGTVLIALWGYVVEKEHAAAAAALAQFNAEQATVAKQDADKYAAQLAQVTTDETALQTKLDAANAAVAASQADLEAWIAKQPEQNTPVVTVKGKNYCGLNPIYNQVLRKLKGN